MINLNLKKKIISLNNEWNLYSISLEDSINYFKNYNLDILDNLLINKNTEFNCMNIDTINWSNSIIYDIINNNDNKLFSLYDNSLYEIFNISFSYKDSPVIIYWFNINNPFFLIQLSSYMDFFYFGDYNQKKIIEISHSTAGHEYYLNDIIINLLKIPKKQNIKLYNFYKNKFIYYGFNSNVGHHLWNELSALYYFLKNNSFHNKICGIIIGPYDIFNIKEYLIKNYNFKIFDFENINGKIFHNCNYLLNNFPCFLNTHYIEENINEFFNIKKDIKENIIELTFDIKTNRILIINCDIFNQNIINDLLNDFKDYNFKINFCGCFSNKCYNINKKNNQEYLQQINIVNKIISKISSNRIIFKILIGENIIDIFNEIINSNLCCLTMGTSPSNLLNWIFRNKCICIGTIESYQWTDIQFKVLKNYNAILSPIEYIETSINGLQGEFQIKYPLFYDFFKKELINTF